MNAHTPGPWVQHPDYPQIVKQDGRPISDIADGVLICSACAHPGSGFYPSEEEGLANARLIAAAPDLLGALRAIVAECSPGSMTYSADSYLPEHLLDAASAAIAATEAA